MSVFAADVTGMKPAVAKGLAVGLRQTVIARRNVWATHDHLTRSTGRYLVASVVDDAQIDSWQGLAGTCQARRVAASERLEVMVMLEERQDWRGIA